MALSPTCELCWGVRFPEHVWPPHLGLPRTPSSPHSLPSFSYKARYGASVSFFFPVVVAEVTQPSLGVGYELGRAIALNKRILCLFRPQSGRGEHSQPRMVTPSPLSFLRTQPSAPFPGGGLYPNKGWGREHREVGVGGTFIFVCLSSAFSHDPGSSRWHKVPGVGL